MLYKPNYQKLTAISREKIITKHQSLRLTNTHVIKQGGLYNLLCFAQSQVQGLYRIFFARSRLNS